MQRNSIVVYFHRAGLRARSCQSTVYPLSYDKNASRKPGAKFTANFNQWAQDIREANMSEGEIMGKRLAEAKELLNVK